ncbi:hypothetical protein MBLNU13_g03013t1 [Cladosporium sp. NU13]
MLLDREQLRNLVLSQPAPQEETQLSAGGDVTSPGTNDAPSVPSLSDLQTTQNWNTLDTLDQAPELDAASDEITRRRSAVHGISDDVNGLSFSLRTNSSYVGVSSVNAALKAIFKVAPHVQLHLAQHCPGTAQPSRAPSPSPAPSPEFGSDMGQYALPPPDIAEKLIDSYFDNIHAMMPMIDEDAFRQSFLYDQRLDVPWLALFNVVLALGSLAAGTCHSTEHITYARRAQHILSQKSLGSNNLLILQAHGLLSGYYLHWLNRPNEAHAMMAVMVPILSLATISAREGATSGENNASAGGLQDPSSDEREWESQIRTAIGIFDRMSSYSLAAVKSKIVVEQLLHACKHMKRSESDLPPADQSQEQLQREGFVGVFQGSLDNADFSALEFDAQEPGMDFLWDDMAWESMSGTLENMPFANPHDFEFEDTFEL